MSAHPNAMLMAVLTPDDLARKTYRAILEEAGITPDDFLKIGERDYSVQIMEDSYDEGYQISAPEGSIVLHCYLTYGYGEVVEWSAVEAQKVALEEWATAACERHKCSFRILISANYW